METSDQSEKKNETVVELEVERQKRKAPSPHKKWLINYDVMDVPAKKGTQEKKIGKSCKEIYESLKGMWKDPIRRIGHDLFVVTGNDIKLLKKGSELFGWLGTQDIKVDWIKGSDGIVSKEEFLEYLAWEVEGFGGISHTPQWPPNPELFYMTHEEVPCEQTGALDQLISMWTPASEIDRLLLKCALITPFWGGPPGARICFVFDGEDGDADGGRGIGKSKFTEAVAFLCGGYIDLDLRVAGDEVKRRILSATTQSIIRYDNIKNLKASSDVLESLITSKIISGHKFGKGLRSMINKFTYMMTFNGVSLSKDMAKRTALIRLRRPTYVAGWEEGVENFLEENKTRLLSDIRYLLSQEPGNWPIHTRFGAWERQVAQRVFQRELNLEGDIVSRQSGIDDDDNEAEQIAECFEVNIAKYYRYGFSGRLQFDLDQGYGILIERRLAARWVREYLQLSGYQSLTSILKRVRRASLPQVKSVDYRLKGPERYVLLQKDSDSSSTFSNSGIGAWAILKYDDFLVPDDQFHKFRGT